MPSPHQKETALTASQKSILDPNGSNSVEVFLSHVATSYAHSPDWRTDTKVQKLQLMKNTKSGAGHEYIAATVKIKSKEVVHLFERAANFDAMGSSSGKSSFRWGSSSNSSSSVSHSSGSSSGLLGSKLASDAVRNAAAVDSQDKGIIEFKPTSMVLGDIALIASLVSGEAPNYHLLKYNCFWWAFLVYVVAYSRFGVTNADENAIEKAEKKVKEKIKAKDLAEIYLHLRISSDDDAGSQMTPEQVEELYRQGKGGKCALGSVMDYKDAKKRRIQLVARFPEEKQKFLKTVEQQARELKATFKNRNYNIGQQLRTQECLPPYTPAMTYCPPAVEDALRLANRITITPPPYLHPDMCTVAYITRKRPCPATPI